MSEGDASPNPSPVLDDGARPGRPSSIDDIAKGKLLVARALGLTQREAALWAGCSRNALRHLILRDARFRRELKDYVELSGLHPLLRVFQEAGQSWRAAAAILERLEKTGRAPTTDALLDALFRLDRLTENQKRAEDEEQGGG